jgi:hypothetical protein
MWDNAVSKARFSSMGRPVPPGDRPRHGHGVPRRNLPKENAKVAHFSLDVQTEVLLDEDLARGARLLLNPTTTTLATAPGVIRSNRSADVALRLRRKTRIPRGQRDLL